MHADVQTSNPATNYVPIPLRSHNILGVCEAIGEDFGINPMWIRIPLASGVLVSPTYAFVTYFVLGAIVLASRVIFPRAKATKVAVDNPKTAVPANSDVEQRLAA